MGSRRRRRQPCGGGSGRRKKLILRVAWDLSTVAQYAAQITKAAIESGDPVPEDSIPPEIPVEAVFAYAAFNELASDRDVGMGAGPIPFTAIDAYAWRYGIADTDEFDRFRILIRAIEREQVRQKADN